MNDDILKKRKKAYKDGTIIDVVGSTTKNQEIIWKNIPNTKPKHPNAFYIKKEYIRTMKNQKTTWLVYFIMYLFLLWMSILISDIIFAGMLGYFLRDIVILIKNGKRDNFLWYEDYLTEFNEWDLSKD